MLHCCTKIGGNVIRSGPAVAKHAFKQQESIKRTFFGIKTITNPAAHKYNIREVNRIQKMCAAAQVSSTRTKHIVGEFGYSFKRYTNNGIFMGLSPYKELVSDNDNGYYRRLYVSKAMDPFYKEMFSENADRYDRREVAKAIDLCYKEIVGYNANGHDRNQIYKKYSLPPPRNELRKDSDEPKKKKVKPAFPFPRNDNFDDLVISILHETDFIRNVVREYKKTYGDISIERGEIVKSGLFTKEHNLRIDAALKALDELDEKERDILIQSAHFHGFLSITVFEKCKDKERELEAKNKDEAAREQIFQSLKVEVEQGNIMFKYEMKKLKKPDREIVHEDGYWVLDLDKKDPAGEDFFIQAKTSFMPFVAYFNKQDSLVEGSKVDIVTTSSSAKVKIPRFRMVIFEITYGEEVKERKIISVLNDQVFGPMTKWCRKTFSDNWVKVKHQFSGASKAQQVDDETNVGGYISSGNQAAVLPDENSLKNTGQSISEFLQLAIENEKIATEDIVEIQVTVPPTGATGGSPRGAGNASDVDQLKTETIVICADGTQKGSEDLSQTDIPDELQGINSSNNNASGSQDPVRQSGVTPPPQGRLPKPPGEHNVSTGGLQNLPGPAKNGDDESSPLMALDQQGEQTATGTVPLAGGPGHGI